MRGMNAVDTGMNIRMPATDKIKGRLFNVVVRRLTALVR